MIEEFRTGNGDPRSTLEALVFARRIVDLHEKQARDWTKRLPDRSYSAREAEEDRAARAALLPSLQGFHGGRLMTTTNGQDYGMFDPTRRATIVAMLAFFLRTKFEISEKDAQRLLTFRAREGETPTVATLEDGSRVFFIGVDWGKVDDFGSMLVCRQNDGVLEVLDEQRWKN